MSLIEKIPEMTDSDVANLLANARRLSETGDPKQRAAAADLLPALEESFETRRAAKLQAAAAKRTVKRTVKATGASKAA